MTAMRNRYAVSVATATRSAGPSFGISMKWALIMPLVIAAAGYSAQWTFRFPALSGGAAITAGALLLSVVSELIAVLIATTKLIRHRELRSGLNLTLTLIPALLLAGALGLTALALISG